MALPSRAWAGDQGRLRRRTGFAALSGLGWVIVLVVGLVVGGILLAVWL